MRILIIFPSQNSATGNHLTAGRHKSFLEKIGHQVSLLQTDGIESRPIDDAIQTFKPDVVHLLHAYKAGNPWLMSEASSHVPFVLTLTGTDVHHNLHCPQTGPRVREVLSQASSVITQNPLTFKALKERALAWRDKLSLVAPGISFGKEALSLRRSLQIATKEILFLHPAGLRPVKDNLGLLSLFDEVAQNSSEPFRIVFCGPPLDEEYAQRFFSALKSRSWAIYAGVIPPEKMAAAYQEVDVVLNNSISEGMPNALVEAASLGVPILAKDNDGNAAVVQEGANGYLYRDDLSFIRRCGELLRSRSLRESLQCPRHEQYCPEGEARALEAIYQASLQSSSDNGPPRKRATA